MRLHRLLGGFGGCCLADLVETHSDRRSRFRSVPFLDSSASGSILHRGKYYCRNIMIMSPDGAGAVGRRRPAMRPLTPSLLWRASLLDVAPWGFGKP